MGRDRDKLVMILNELERDYRAGNISEEKYFYLHRQYEQKIETIDVSNRIRVMQGRKNYSPNNQVSQQLKDNQLRIINDSNKRQYNSKNKEINGYYDESGQFHSFVNNSNESKSSDSNLNPENFDNIKINNKQESTNKTNNVVIGILLTIILLFAFGTGIVMGIFNTEVGNDLNGEISELIGDGASINDTAFPIVKKNISSFSNYKYKSSNSNQDLKYYSKDSTYSSSESTSSSGVSGSGSSSGGYGSGSGSGSSSDGDSSGTSSNG